MNFVQFNMTPAQAALHSFIGEYIARKGYAPSYAEMAAHLGVVSKSNIHRLILGLEERGRIARIPARKRCIVVL